MLNALRLPLPSMNTPSKSCDSSLELSANANLIACAVAREESSCSLRAFKRSENFLPSLSERTMFQHAIHAHYVTYFRCWFLFTFCTKKEYIKKKSQIELNFRFQSAILLRFQTCELFFPNADCILDKNMSFVSCVISPDFLVELTGFFPGKQFIHFLVLKMKDFSKFLSG